MSLVSDEMFDGHGGDVSDQFTKKLKAAMAMMSGRGFYGTQKSHRRLITRLKMAFKMREMRRIVNDDPEVLETFLNDPDNAEVYQMSEVVLESALEFTLDKGAAYTKLKMQERVGANNVRAMYDAARGAHTMSTTKLTKRKLKGELREIKWEDGKDHDVFIDELMETSAEFEDLEDPMT
jgi:hypothetical protein